MKICISGLSASGKSTVGKTLAKELNIAHVEKTYRAFAKSEEKLIDFIKDTVDRKIGTQVDNDIIEMAKDKDCVVTTWLAGWIIKDATLRVWLEGSPEIRAQRRAKDLGADFKTVLKEVKERDMSTTEHFKKDLGYDITDRSAFDITLNAEKMSVNEMVSVISLLALERDKKRFA